MSGAEADKKTGYLELFFDLVFVFAVTQLVTVLHADHSGAGWRNTVLLAWLVWWAWSQFAWAGNAIDLDRRATRVAILAITGVTLVVAAAIPAAMGSDGGLRFALPYAAVRFGGLALYWLGLRGDPAHRQALRSYLPVAVVSPAVVLLGGALSPEARPWVFVAAVAIDIASAIAGGRGEFRVAPGHFAERHALIVIIALGESIVGIGATVTESALTGAVAAVVGAAFVILGTQWWGYFDWFQVAAEHRLASETDLRLRGRLARDVFTFGHFPIVLGSVLVAFGIEEAVAHPSVRLEAAGLWSIGAGLALFYAGFVVGNLRASGGWLPERLGALGVVVVATSLIGPRLSALVYLCALAASLATLAAVETHRRMSVSSP